MTLLYFFSAYATIGADRYTKTLDPTEGSEGRNPLQEKDL